MPFRLLWLRIIILLIWKLYIRLSSSRIELLNFVILQVEVRKVDLCPLNMRHFHEMNPSLSQQFCIPLPKNRVVPFCSVAKLKLVNILLVALRMRNLKTVVLKSKIRERTVWSFGGEIWASQSGVDEIPGPWDNTLYICKYLPIYTASYPRILDFSSYLR